MRFRGEREGGESRGRAPVRRAGQQACDARGRRLKATRPLSYVSSGERIPLQTLILQRET
eukprot:1178437-Prorocentrum_minimum.AAC.2